MPVSNVIKVAHWYVLIFQIYFPLHLFMCGFVIYCSQMFGLETHTDFSSISTAMLFHR